MAGVASRFRCLNSVYSLMNVTNADSLLKPFFQVLDQFKWLPLEFTHKVLKPMTNTKVAVQAAWEVEH